MSKSTDVIISEIKLHIGSDSPANWYAGIACDPRDRLFADHCVDKDNGSWIFREAMNSESARAAENHLLNVLGCDGGSGGGDYNSKYVYAYKKTPSTDEDA